MPSKKILFVIILCLGVVVSIYLLSKNSGVFPSRDGGDISTNPYINLKNNSNSDWQKILSDIDLSKSTTTSLLDTNPGVFDDTTLTAQMSRDFLSQYLIATKKGAITSEEAEEIARITLLVPEYTKGVKVRYGVDNINIVNNTGTFNTYKNSINQSLKEKSTQVKDNPLEVFSLAINSASETKLAKLDPIILLNKSLLTDLLTMDVPNSAVEVHLSLLNVVSGLLSDLEAMRRVFIDPVSGLLGVGQYQKDIISFKTAVTNMNIYLMQN